MRNLIICILSLFSIAHLNSQDLKTNNDIQRLVDLAVSKGECIGLSAGFYNEESGFQVASAGMSNKEESTSFDHTTITRMASLAKPITAVAILQLHEKGKLHLDDEVAKYLPEFANARLGKITIKNVIQHTSGIDGYQNDKDNENYTHYETMTDAMHKFIDRPLVFAPGSDFRYSSYGYVVLGCII